MWYKDRAELDKISKAGVLVYESEVGNPIVRMHSGFWLECEKNEAAFSEPVQKTGNWEAWVACAISESLHDGADLFVDVGANVGYYTCMSMFCGVETLSFEPFPKAIEFLKRNIKLNSNFGTKARLYKKGAGLEKTKLPMKVYEDHSGGNSFHLVSDDKSNVYLDIVRLDEEIINICKSKSKIVFKVDVEGLEQDVWYGSKKIIELGNTHWFIEWVPERHAKQELESFLNNVSKTHSIHRVNFSGGLDEVSIKECMSMKFDTLHFSPIM